MSNEKTFKTTKTTTATDCNLIPENFQVISQSNISLKTSSSSSSSLINPAITSTISEMPSLVHHNTTKRKRLDAVLTKLSMTTNKSSDETTSTTSSSTMAESSECAAEIVSLFPSSSQSPGSSSSETALVPKSPKKQLSLDSEMSMNVGQLNLNIVGDTASKVKASEKTLGSPISSTTTSTSPQSSSMLFSPSKAGNEYSVETGSGTTTTATLTTEEHSLIFNSGSNLSVAATISTTLATTTSSATPSSSSMPIMSALFTPPTSDSAGGTVEFEEEELDDEDQQQDVKNNDDHGETTRTGTTTTVKTIANNNNAKYGMLDSSSDNLFGSHDFNTTTAAQEPLILTKKWPQAKLLSHDFGEVLAHKQLKQERQEGEAYYRQQHRDHDQQQNVHTQQEPDTQQEDNIKANEKMAQTQLIQQPVASVAGLGVVSRRTESSVSSSIVAQQSQNKISSSTIFKLPSYIGEPSSSCITTSDHQPMPSSMIISSHRASDRQRQHCLSWLDSSKTPSLLAAKPSSESLFDSLLLPTAGSIESSALNKSQFLLDSIRQTIKKEINEDDDINRSGGSIDVADQSNKKRSYSDSDVLGDYFDVFKHISSGFTAATSSSYSQSSYPTLPRAESGLILLKNGRSVPKPLNKYSLVQSEHCTPQDSPLDLSVKSLNPNTPLIAPSHHHYHQYPLIIDSFQQHRPQVRTPFSNVSCSVPSLNTIFSQRNFQFPSSQDAIFGSSQSFKIPEHQNEPPTSSSKRRNRTGSSSTTTTEASYSSLSSVSSMSPLETSAKIMEKSSKNIVVETSGLKLSKSDDSVPICGAGSKCTQTPSKESTITSSSLNDLEHHRLSFACNICGQTFSLGDRLAKHIASRHKNRQQCDSVAKNYLCEICQRSFARSDMLTRHMRLHTGIKPYTCKICDQVFSRSDHLSTHQRTHTGEKPYKCPQCPYAACRRDMITRHMRTHSRYETPDSSSSTEELSK